MREKYIQVLEKICARRYAQLSTRKHLAYLNFERTIYKDLYIVLILIYI